MVRAPTARKSPAWVLVVEDEVLTRVVIADELRDEGFLVVEAQPQRRPCRAFEREFK
jgi:hypothetical protein